MEVLVRQANELDASSVSLERVFQGGRLRCPDDWITLLLPCTEQRLEAWGSIRHGC